MNLRIDTKDRQKVFALILLMLFSLHLIFGCYGIGNQGSIMYRNGFAYLSDSTLVGSFTADMDPYRFGAPIDSADFLRNYPPLSYLIFRVQWLLITYSIQTPNASLIVYNLFLFFYILLFFLVLREFFSGSSLLKSCLAFSLLISSIMVCSYERGNITILSGAMCAIFLLGYDSPNKCLREIALIALAVAAALKVYPALFGILLITKKRWKEAIRTLIYGAVLAFLPFFFFRGGLRNVPTLVRNAVWGSYIYSIPSANFPRFGFRYFANNLYVVSILLRGLPFEGRLFSYSQFLSEVCPIFDAVVGSLLVLGLWQKDEEWKRAASIATIIMIIPANSPEYAGMYIFPIIAMFLSHEKWNKLDNIYFVLFLLLLNPLRIYIPLDIGVPYQLDLSTMLMNLAATAVFLMLAVESVVQWVRWIAAHRPGKALAN